MEEIEMLKEEIAKLKEDREIELLLTKNGVKSLKAAMAIFDRESLKKDENGDFENLSGAVNNFKNDNSWLFEKASSSVSTGISHGRGSGRSLSDLTDDEYYRALKEKRCNNR